MLEFGDTGDGGAGHMKGLKEQMYGVKRTLRQAKKISLVVPSEFTFNRSGTKHFDPVLAWMQWDLQNIPVEIDFTRCDSANFQAMSLLILYCWKLKQQHCTVSFKYHDGGEYNGTQVWRMLGAPSLFAIATDPKLNFGGNKHKPLFAIRNSDDFRAATATVEQFCAQFAIEYQDTLRYVLSELLYNVLEHGCSDFTWNGRRFPTPSIAQFTWYEKINEIHFIVADIGVGIRQHLTQSYSFLATDEDAIRLALQPEVSGTFGRQDPYNARNNAGMGLYLSSNIAKKLRGDMYIGSGTGLVHVSPADTTSRELSAAWPGTFVLLTIRVDRGSILALDSMMNEFRERARDEVASREKAQKQDQYLVSVYNYFGRRPEVKSEAIAFRDKRLLPAVKEGKSVVLDFTDIRSSTHSFLNALLASPIRTLGVIAYKRIRIVHAIPEIRETLDYIFDDNTNDG
jgi:hypothetical protein